MSVFSSQENTQEKGMPISRSQAKVKSHHALLFSAAGFYPPSQPDLLTRKEKGTDLFSKVRGENKSVPFFPVLYGAQGVAGYAGNYVASKAAGLDTSFSWKSMAASAIGSVVAGSINQSSGFWNSTVRGQISAHSSAWMRDKWFGGGRPDYGQVAADAFGNSLVDYMVGNLRSEELDKRAREEDLRKQIKALSANEAAMDRQYKDLRYAVASLAGGSSVDYRAEYGVDHRWFELESATSGEDFTYSPPTRNSDGLTLDDSSDAYYPELNSFVGPVAIGSISADPGYITNVHSILKSDISMGDKLGMVWGTTKYAFRGSDAAQGTMQIVGGGIEVAGAAGLTTTGLGWAMAVPLALHGGDSMGTGFSRVFNGGDGTTLTYQATYELTGSPLIAQGVDLGIPLFGGVEIGRAHV